MDNIKYVKEIHFESLIESGSIKIGTLKDYKESEHGKMVTDPMEGITRFSGSYESISPNTIRSNSALSKVFSFGREDQVQTEEPTKAEELRERITFNLKITDFDVVGPDYYIFSFSKTYNQDDHQEWDRKQGYNAAYSIVCPNTFFRKITKQLNTIMPVKFLGLFEVQYYDENKGMDFFDPRHRYPGFCLKGYDDFSSQKEIRAVWEPLKNVEISPLILEVVSLGHCIELKTIMPTH
ncbi:TPA: hypothetical protein KD866_002409 [Vibrio parahaemolyticus]|nr:hypothetical protein [Vibrio parahaemolyticus]